MTHILALSVGESGSVTPISNLPQGVASIVGDSQIITHLIGLVLDLFFFAALIIIIFLNLYYGYKYIVSQGDKKELDQIRSGFWNGILGFIVICISFLVVNLIGYFFNINLLHPTLP